MLSKLNLLSVHFRTNVHSTLKWGDSFGFSNAMVSGLGFFAVAYTLYLQQVQTDQANIKHLLQEVRSDLNFIRDKIEQYHSKELQKEEWVSPPVWQEVVEHRVGLFFTDECELYNDSTEEEVSEKIRNQANTVIVESHSFASEFISLILHGMERIYELNQRDLISESETNFLRIYLLGSLSDYEKILIALTALSDHYSTDPEMIERLRVLDAVNSEIFHNEIQRAAMVERFPSLGHAIPTL